MNCGICGAYYLRLKNKCPGCRIENNNKPNACFKCKIKNWEVFKNRKIKFCHECKEFPCDKVKHLDKRYGNKYNMSMIESLEREIEGHGDKCKIVSIEWLNDLKKDIDHFTETEGLNQFQKYIINKLYMYEAQDVDFKIRSIIIIAVPRPVYANVEFTRQGKKYLFKNPALSNIDSEDAKTVTKKYLKKYLDPKNFHIEYAPNLPLKRFSVRSGLALYGRNNICYVDGMGSFLTLVAYFTDFVCNKGNWEEIKHADICFNCKSCIENCPTASIRKDRFLIDNARCLSYFNESPGEFPEWLPLSVHHCIYDCLKCQVNCPMNKKYSNNVIGPIKFNEEETSFLLAGKQFNEFDFDLQKKVKVLGMDQYLTAIPRNLKILFELNNQ